MKKFILLSMPFLVLTGCISQEKYDSALSTIDSLRVANNQLMIENDELKNGEERLANLFEKNAKEGNFVDAENTYKMLIEKHPETKLLEAKTELVNEVLKMARLMKDSLEKVKKDSIRLANIDKLGDWKIGDFVDDFKEPTGKHYLIQKISGIFSNSATAGSKCTITVQVYQDYRNSIEIDMKFDKYSDGTIDHSYWSERSTGKIVCKDTHTVYVDYGGGFHDQDNHEVYVSLENILEQEKEFEYNLKFKDGTSYSFIIDTKYYDNALIKAGIKEL